MKEFLIKNKITLNKGLIHTKIYCPDKSLIFTNIFFRQLYLELL